MDGCSFLKNKVLNLKHLKVWLLCVFTAWIVIKRVPSGKMKNKTKKYEWKCIRESNIYRVWLQSISTVTTEMPSLWQRILKHASAQKMDSNCVCVIYSPGARTDKRHIMMWLPTADSFHSKSALQIVGCHRIFFIYIPVFWDTDGNVSHVHLNGMERESRIDR